MIRKAGTTRPLTHWLPERAVIRTKHQITIPYNPQLYTSTKKTKKPYSTPKPKNNILKKAEKYDRLLAHGIAKNKSELAQQEGLSRARITQILNLLRLAPEIKDYLTSLDNQKELRFYTERRLREIAKIKDHETQLGRFEELKEKAGATDRFQKALA